MALGDGTPVVRLFRQTATGANGFSGTPVVRDYRPGFNLVGIDGLTGADRDAAVALTNLFRQYGLESLAPRIVDFIKQGYGPDVITIMLQETPEYKQRFAANDKRVAAGLPALSLDITTILDRRHDRRVR